MFALFANIMTEPYPILKALPYLLPPRADRRLAARPTGGTSETKLMLWTHDLRRSGTLGYQPIGEVTQGYKTMGGR